MKARTLFLTALALWCAASKHAVLAQDEDPPERQALMRQAGQLLESERFDELEKMAHEFRTQKSRLPGGLWKLHFFYQGMIPSRRKTTGEEWPEILARLEGWKNAYPNSITAHIALARGYTRYAWAARGGSYAREVAEEGWRLFRERLAHARQVLEQADNLPSKCPEWFHAMQVVALGQNWARGEYEALFERAVKFELSYHQFYRAKANYLLPRWYGRPGDLERFAEQAVELTRHLEGEGFYARVAWAVLPTAKKDNFFELYNFSWPRIRQGFLDIEQRHPDSNWNLNHFCKFACMAGDRNTAHGLFRRIGDNWTVHTWKSAAELRKWRDWATEESGQAP